MVNVIVSSAGVQGPAGNTILSGEGAPGAGVGVDGDFYADITEYPTSLTLYGPKAGTWPEQGIVLSGADGAVMSVNGQTGEVTITAAGIEALAAANNFSDLTNPATARTNLGLGGAAVLSVGTGSGTVAAGNDSRITGAAQTANNLSDLQSASTARTNLGLGSAATQASSAFDAAGSAATAQSNAETFATTAITALDLGGASQLNVGTAAGTVAAGNDARITGALQAANNLSDVGSPSVARTNLGLASGATAAAASTVTAASSYGQSTAVGTDTTYAREDHSHGTPALTTTAPATTLGVGQFAVVGSATLPARADHVHPLAAAGAPAASAVTSAQATGVATTFAASDHVHAREGFGAVTAQTSFGASSGSGSASTVSHSDHTHGTPTLPTATTGAPGIVQLDGTATDIQALGAQAAGASGLAADAGHVHPTTGVVTGITAADTSLVVGGTSGAPTVRTATLDVIATQHPPAAAWSNNSHNITHVANGSAASDAAAFGQIPVAATNSVPGTIQLAGDIAGGTATAPQVTSTHLAAALPVAQGGTGQASAGAAFSGLSPITGLGDLIYGSAANTASRLAGSTSATKSFLVQTGTGSVSAAPAWGGIAASDLPAATTLAVGGVQFDGTATDISSLGAQTAGSTGKAADAGHVHPAYEFMPSDQGLAAWNFDPSCAGTTFVPTSTINGNIFLTAMILRTATTITNVVYGLSGAQTSGLTAGENWIGLYNSAGTLLATTADQTTIWSTTADQKVNVVPLLSPFPEQLAAGKYFIAFLFNGVTTGAALNFKASGAGTTANAGQTGANMRYGWITGTATTLPGSLALSSMALPSPFNSHWLALS